MAHTQFIVKTDENNAIVYYGDIYSLGLNGIHVLDPETAEHLYHIYDITSINGEVYSVPEGELPDDIEPHKYLYIPGSGSDIEVQSYDEYEHFPSGVEPMEHHTTVHKHASGYEFVLNPYFEEKKDLTQLRIRLARDVHDFRNEYLSGGFIFGGVMFQSDPYSIALLNNATTGILAMNMLGIGATSYTPWTTASNQTVLVHPNEFLIMAANIVQWFSRGFNAARAHKDIILYDLDTREELLNYDYTTDWWPSRDLGGYLEYAPQDLPN